MNRIVLAGVLLALLVGCQTPPQRAQQESTLRSLGFVQSDDGWMLTLPEPIQFDVGKDELKAETRQTVAEVAQALRRVGIKRIRVEGHTDNLGTREYNMELARRRAEAVARELQTHGFANDAIVRKAWAFDFPVAPNDTPDGRAQNRRVTIVVLGPDMPAQ